MNRICSWTLQNRCRCYSSRIGLTLFTAIMCSFAAFAQRGPAAPPKRMTVGVALEGCGALGLAHIGVLRWFEQHHIPIDYLSINLRIRF